MKSEVLEISENINDGVCKLVLKGRIDSNNSEKLLEKLEALIKDGQTSILMNMSQIKYLSSGGIRVILKIYKQMTETNGKFNIEAPSEIVKNVLGMVALNELLVN
ncbi:MAG: STAS domain-containing protein [Treponema sp.]|jgi:anti-anti-sigma factor|nr:STAS domain-containing protein [Treponema sp.]